jgi:hypothetical protein
MAKAPITKSLAEEDEKPLDPAMEKVRRKMIRLLGVSIGVMMAGLMAVLFAIVYKMNSSSSDKPVATATSSGALASTGEIALPEGAYLNGQSLSGDRLSLDVTLKGGAREIQIFDLAEQKIVARYGVTAK